MFSPSKIPSFYNMLKLESLLKPDVTNIRIRMIRNTNVVKQSLENLCVAGDDAASFTKEEMQQGKHTDYEKQLHEEMLAGLALIAAGESPPSSQHSVEQDRERGRLTLCTGTVGTVPYLLTLLGHFFL